MRQTITDLGSIGINLDLQPWQQPINAWTGGGNFRCRDGMIGVIEGLEHYFDISDENPVWLLPATDQESYYWLVASLTHVYLWDGTTLNDISDIAYGGTEKNRWSGGALGTVPIITNGFDAPRSLTRVTVGEPLKVLNYDESRTWDEVGYRARVIRPFRDVMIAMGIEDQDGSHPLMVHWSDPADPGLTPKTWDYTLPTNNSGRQELATSIGARTSGRIIDGLHIGNRFFIYKTDSVWSLDFVSNQFVMATKPIAGLRGMLALGCVVEVEGSHVVLGDEDLYIHRGQEPRSLINKKLQRYLFRVIDTEEYWRSYLVKNRARNEIWVCIPTSGAKWPNLALIWNFRDDTFSLRDLPDCPFIERGVTISEESDKERWDSLPDYQWINWEGSWGEELFSPINDFLVGISASQPAGVPQQIVDDPGFENPGAWTEVQTAQGTAIVDQSKGKFDVTYAQGGVYPSLQQAGVFSAGETYEVSLDVTVLDGVVVRVYNGTHLIVEITSVSTGTVGAYLAAEDGDLIITVAYPGAGDPGSAEVDNMSVMGLVPGGPATVIFDKGWSVNGAAIPSWIEKITIPFKGDIGHAMINKVYPHMSGDADVQVYFGTQLYPTDSVSWTGPYPFNPSTDRKIDARATGAFHSIRIESQDTREWKISGYSIEYEPAGER